MAPTPLIIIDNRKQKNQSYSNRIDVAFENKHSSRQKCYTENSERIMQNDFEIIRFHARLIFLLPGKFKLLENSKNLCNGFKLTEVSFS